MPLLKVDWSKFDHLLGTDTDEALAKHFGCTKDNVRFRRKKLNIAPAKYPTWTDDDKSLLNKGQQRCVDCKEVKCQVEFQKENSRRTGHRRICKSCISADLRNKRLELKRQCVDVMGGECQSCSFERHLSSLQFHHVGDEKDYQISEIMHEPGLLQEELDRCCLLCSNCHDAYHGGELELRFEKRHPIGWTVSSGN